MFQQKQEILNKINEHFELTNTLIKQKEEKCYQYSKTMTAYADCMWNWDKKTKKFYQQDEFFIRFCELHYNECIQKKEEEKCIRQAEQRFDQFNYILKDGQLI